MQELLKKYNYQPFPTTGSTIYYINSDSDLAVALAISKGLYYPILIDKITCKYINYRSINFRTKKNGHLRPCITVNNRTEYLHRVVMHANRIEPPNFTYVIDHINHCKLDVRVQNLRYCKTYQNNINRANVKSVRPMNSDIVDFIYDRVNDFNHVGGIELLINHYVLGLITEVELKEANKRYWNNCPQSKPLASPVGY